MCASAMDEVERDSSERKDWMTSGAATTPISLRQVFQLTFRAFTKPRKPGEARRSGFPALTYLHLSQPAGQAARKRCAA
jgi:hypothetical protein